MCLAEEESKNFFDDLFADIKEVETTKVNEKELKDKLSNLPDDGQLFEGDIVMDSRLRNAVLGISKKSVVADDSYKWPDGILYYEVEPGFSKQYIE